MKKILMTLLTCSFALAHGQIKETLKAFVERANYEEEYVKSDNKDLHDPDFLRFYQEKDPSFFGLILVRLGLAEPLWNPYDLVPHLKAVTALRKEIIKKRPFFERLEVAQGAHIIVIGDLHGAFHSFVRDVTELKRRGLIDERLTLTDRSTYLIFLGDVVNGTPYSLYLLELILTLIERNPEHVMYLRGDQETASHWSDFSALKTQLKRWGHFWGSKGKEFPLKNELDELFNSLPDGAILYNQHNPDQLIMIGSLALQAKQNKESRIEAYILGERLLQGLRQIYGLDFRGFEKGSATWTLVSSPTLNYQEFLQFKNDTFCIMEIAGQLRDSLLSVYYQDAHKKDGFSREQYVVSLGLELTKEAPGATYPTFLVGSSMALSGGLSTIGRGLKLGMEVAAMRANERGGIGGLYIKPLVLDDQYDPRLAKKRLKTLLKTYQLDALVCPLGSPTLDSYIKRVKRGECDVFFPITGNPQFRTPDIEHIIHFRGNYTKEIFALVDHVVTQYTPKRFALLYQNDAFGIPLVEGAHKALEERGIKDWIDIPFFREQTVFDDSIKKLLSADPEAMGLFFSSSSLARSFLSKAGVSFVVGRHPFTTAVLADESFRIFLDKTGIPMTFSYIVPDPWGSTLPLVEEYRSEMKKQQKTEDCNSLEGYLGMSLFLEALTKIKEPFTGKRARQFMEGLRDYPFKGLTLTFNPQTRSFTLPVWIRSEEGKWFTYE